MYILYISDKWREVPDSKLKLVLLHTHTELETAWSGENKPVSISIYGLIHVKKISFPK
jgi:hypothetical protein